MTNLMPKHVFLTKGVGRHKEKLASFEQALRKAGIACFNLVRVSSILPPHCEIIPRKKGLSMIQPGQILHCVIAESASCEHNRLMAASIGIAVPKDRSQYGYLSEHHAFGQTDNVAGEYAEDLAATMLASTLGIEFDPDSGWDERKDVYFMGGQIVRSQHITQSAIGHKSGHWTTVVAAAVMVL